MLFVQDDTFNKNNNNNNNNINNINNVPDYFPPNVCHDIVPEEENNNNNNKIKNFRAVKDYHEDEDEDFYFLGQHLNTPGLLDDEYPDYYDSNFEIANRAFYATINKFTRQSCPEPSRRKTSYSFLENWHLHSIYSKSQQTLLGITPVRPSVLLSGDDFMFTPPFVPPENSDQLEFDWEESDDSEFYSLSPCPESNQAGQFVPLSASYDVQNSLMLSASSPPPTPPQSHPSDTATPYMTEKEDKINNYYDSFNESALLNENSWIENQRRPRSLSGFDVNETMNANHNLISDNVHNISLHDTNDNHVIDMSEDLLTSYLSNDQQFTSSSSSSSSGSEGENEIEQDFQDYDDDEDDEEEEEEEYDDFEYTDDEAYDDDDDDDYDDNNDDIDYNKRRSGELSTFNFEHLYEPTSTENEIVYKEFEEAPMTRSSSFLSHKSAEMPRMTPSIMSYQSLADILSSPSSSSPLPSPSISPSVKHYGAIRQGNTSNGNTLIFKPVVYNQGVVQVVKSTMAAILDLSDAYASHYDEEMAITSVQSTSPESGSSSNSFWACTFAYILYIWQLLVLCSESVIVNIRKHIMPHRQ